MDAQPWLVKLAENKVRPRRSSPKYSRAAFVHCAAHRLNLVVNDLNSVAEVHNVIGTVKTIIKFFSERASKDAAWHQMSPCYVKHDGRLITKASESSPTTSNISTNNYCYSFWQDQPRCTPVAMRIWDVLVVPGFHGKIVSDVGASDTSFGNCST